MAGPTLGTLLIQRLDAALGTTLSQQTQIVNRATSNPVPHPGQAVRPQPVPGSLVRDARTNVDRATQGATSGGRLSVQSGAADPTAAGRTPAQSVTTSATTSLGVAARIILNLFADHTASTPPLIARSPLLPTAPQAAAGSPPGATTLSPGTPPAAQATPTGASTINAPTSGGSASLSQTLAQALSQTLQQSGLFYESHLRGLLTGQYRIADIRQEPQAQIPTGAARSDPGPSAGIDPASQSIVRQQLETLADQSIHWRGEAWPGAVMEWQVQRQPQDHEASFAQADHEPGWQSQITVELPQLGPITMDVRLAGARVYVRLQAREDTADLLQQHAGELHGQMTGRQLELTAITFAHPESQGGVAAGRESQEEAAPDATQHRKADTDSSADNGNPR